MNIDGDDDFAAAMAEMGDHVEVGETNLASQAGAPAKEEIKPKIEVEKDGEQTEPTQAEKDAAAADEELGDDATPEQREGYMKRLKRERADARRLLRERDIELATIKKYGLQPRGEQTQNSDLPATENPGTAVSKLGTAPDPNDQAKYPLGHLDAQYVEDRMQWLVDERDAKNSDAAAQRQRDQAIQQSSDRELQALNQKVESIAKSGVELFDDFQEKVVDGAKSLKWPLERPTFEAASEVPHGAAILYELASDTKEAERVAALSPFQQAKYVDKRNDELALKATARKIPGAKPPATQTTRGANSRTVGNPATDDLGAFEAQWEREAGR